MDSLAPALAAAVASELARAIERRGRASLMVSGGQTPAPFFSALARRPIEWPKVIVGLVDERWVAPDHVDSNERLVRHTLLTGRGSAATFVPMKNAAANAAAGQPACERAIAAIPRPFDVVVLGMGNDGHTASLFPHTPQLAMGLDPANPALTMASVPATAAHERMSLTLRGLLESRRIVLLISGSAKWRVYRRARESGPASELPVRAVLEQAATAVDVYACD